VACGAPVIYNRGARRRAARVLRCIPWRRRTDATERTRATGRDKQIESGRDLARERRELSDDRSGEVRELAGIYIKRGLDKALSLQVAEQLMAHDALGAHARDELGISPSTAARPVQAALASAAAFSVGAALPLVMALMAPDALVVWAVSIASLLFLAILGAAGAKTGGAKMLTATVRVTFWGALAMAVTAGLGALFGTQV
jgi:VIT1/CCC1 family predicted Fe2+/Mn2+ transporter